MEKPLKKENLLIIEKLPRKQVFIYGIGASPSFMMAGIFTLMYINFFWNFLGLNQTLFIIGQVIYATINAINDPITGNISDHTNIDKWGSRRLIYIKWCGPIWAILYFFMWFPWSYTDQIVIFIHFILSICIFDTLLSIVIGLYMSLMAEMTDSIEMRNKLYFIFSLSQIFAAVPVFLAQPLFENSLQAFQILNGIIAIISIILYFIAVRILKERPELRIEEDYNLLQVMKDVLRSRAFLTRTGYLFFNVIARSMGLSFLFAFLFILGTGPIVPMLFMIITMGLGYISQVIYMKVAKKWGIRKTIFILKCALIIVNLICFAIIINTDSPPIIWICISISSMFSGFLVFDFTLLTLAIDEDEIKHGSRRESIFQGVSSLIFKPAESIGPIIATSVLLIFGFLRDAPSQSAEAIIGIKILLFVAPSVMHAISLIFIYFFPYHGESLNKLHTDLLNLHSKKKENYDRGIYYEYKSKKK